MQQVGVIALLIGRHAEGLEALVSIVERRKARAPALIREGRISDHIVKGLERATLRKLRVSQRIALHNQRRGVVVQKHVHPGQTARSGVLLLPVERHRSTGRIAHLQQQRTRATGRVIDRGGMGRLGLADTDNLGHNPADLRRSVKLAFALAALRGEVAHQVLIGIAEDVIAVSAVLREVEGLVLKDSDQVREPLNLLLVVAELRGVVKVRHIGQLVGLRERGDDLLIDLIADVARTLEGDHILKAGTGRDRNRREGHTGILIADVLDEQQDEDIVLVLAGVHAAAQLVAARPE